MADLSQPPTEAAHLVHVWGGFSHLTRCCDDSELCGREHSQNSAFERAGDQIPSRALRCRRFDEWVFGLVAACVGVRLFPFPAHDPQVRLLLRGLTRLAAAAGYAPKQAAALRWSDIEHIADTAHTPRRNQPGGRTETPDQADRRGDTDVAMAAVAHDAALRSSELLALTWADIMPSQPDRCGLVTIRRSKTDQTAKGAVTPISKYASDALARLKPADPDPYQRIFNISAATLNRRLKTAARTAGINPAHITSHSPRVGMAQDLTAHGVTMVGLKQAGRWKTSTTASRYTQHLNAHHTPAGQYLKTQHRTNPPDP